jgi:hypothetical protein
LLTFIFALKVAKAVRGNCELSASLIVRVQHGPSPKIDTQHLVQDSVGLVRGIAYRNVCLAPRVPKADGPPD